MATQPLPQIGNTTTDLQALLAAFGQPSIIPSSGISSGVGSSNQSSQSSSSTNPAFVDEMRNLINMIGSGQSPFSKELAIADMEGVATNMARRALETNLPGITTAPRLAGAYNSTTQSLMQNDLAARTTGEIAGAISENINRYAGIEQGYANALANLARAGTSQQSQSTSVGSYTNNQVSSQTGQGQQSNAGKAAIGQLGLSALGGLLGKVGGLAGLFGSGGQGITDIFGTDGPSWNVDSLLSGLSGTNPWVGGTDLGSGTGGVGFNYGGTSGGITDIMGQAGGQSWLDGLMGSIGSGFDSISDWFSFADGGKVPGKAPANRSKDNVPIMARSGEFIMIPEAVSALGEDFFDRINAAFMPASMKGEAKAKKSDSSRTGYATGGAVATEDPMMAFIRSMMPTGETSETLAAKQQAAVDAQRMGTSGAMLQALGGTSTDGTYSFSPTAVTGGAPVIDTNSAEGQAFLQMGNAMDAAWVRQGVNAFIPGDLNYFDFGGDTWRGVQSGETDVVNPDRDQYRESMVKDLTRIANQLNYDISGYDLSSDAAQTSSDQSDLGIQNYNNIAKSLGLSEIVQPKTLTNLYEDLNGILGDFVRYRGASAGWDGSGNMRSTSETLFHNTDGVWTPISSPKSGVKREHGGWAKEEGAELIAGLSVLAPAIGGVAGLFGQAGTAYAPVINAAGNYALTGNPLSLIGAVGNFGGTQLGSAFGLSDSLNNVAGRLGSELAKRLYTQSQQSKRK